MSLLGFKMQNTKYQRISSESSDESDDDQVHSIMPYWENIRPSSTDDDSDSENFTSPHRDMLGQANHPARFVPVRMSENVIPLNDIEISRTQIPREFDSIAEKENKLEGRNAKDAVKFFEALLKYFEALSH